MPSLEREDQAAQLRELLPDLHPKPFDHAILWAWSKWDYEHGLLKRPVLVPAAFQEP